MLEWPLLGVINQSQLTHYISADFIFPNESDHSTPLLAAGLGPGKALCLPPPAASGPGMKEKISGGGFKI